MVDWDNPSPQHLAWVKARIKYLTQRFAFKGKTVLEFGSFMGDVGAALADLGADVVCVEGRQRNVKIARQRFPELIIIEHDLDKPEWPFEQHYDFILHLGLLYHQQSPEYILLEAQKHCDTMVLESQVIDSDEEILEVYLPDDHGPGQGLNGEARPSVAWIENRLKNAEMVLDETINSGRHNYTWEPKNDKSYNVGQRRMWVVTP